jgi:multicomponent Na+:H+ antiporter subunit B
MTRSVRLALFGIAVSGFAALMFWSVAGLPDFGHYAWPYGHVLNTIALPERHATNVVTAIVFDYRGIDTLGEEFILFASVTGVALLLRKDEEHGIPRDEVRNDAIRGLALVVAVMTLMLGLWVVAFGIVTPGGGFQGGVVLAGAFLLVYLGGGYQHFHALTPHSPVEMAEALGAGTFAVLGFVGVVYAGAFLGNFLGIGNAGSLYSGGSIPLLNWATGVEVFAALVVLFAEFLKIYEIPSQDWKPLRGAR